VSLQENSSA